jgi:hypothetical protein
MVYLIENNIAFELVAQALEKRPLGFRQQKENEWRD